jgi:glutaredoxin
MLTRSSVVFCLAVALAGARRADADTVTLKNGKVYVGMVTEENASVVSVLANGSEWMFSHGEVASIVRDAPASVSNGKTKSGAPQSVVQATTLIRPRKNGARSMKRMMDALVRETREPPDLSEPTMPLRVHEAEAEAPKAVEPRAVEPRAGRVVLYGTNWCGYCRKARAYFQEKGIAFTDKDVEADHAAAAELDGKRRQHHLGNGVPVIDIGGQVAEGFDRAWVDAMLARR